VEANMCISFFYRFVYLMCIIMGAPVIKRESLGSHL